MRINRTTQRTIEMLELISKHPNGLSLSEIVNIMNIPKTSAYDILRTLNHLKMVELVDERSKVYALGVKAFVIGSHYISEVDLVKVARPYIQALGDELCKTVFIGIRNGSKIIYLYKYQPKNEILTTCNVGSENDIYCTALGKAILAFSSNYVDEIEKLDLKPITSHTIIDKKELCKQMEEVRRRGYSIDNREHQEHMLCCGSPIFNHEGNVIAAISITGLYIEDKDYTHEFQLVKKTALNISRKLGYTGNLIKIV